MGCICSNCSSKVHSMKFDGIYHGDITEDCQLNEPNKTSIVSVKYQSGKLEPHITEKHRPNDSTSIDLQENRNGSLSTTVRTDTLTETPETEIENKNVIKYVTQAANSQEQLTEAEEGSEEKTLPIDGDCDDQVQFTKLTNQNELQTSGSIGDPHPYEGFDRHESNSITKDDIPIDLPLVTENNESPTDALKTDISGESEYETLDEEVCLQELTNGKQFDQANRNENGDLLESIILGETPDMAVDEALESETFTKDIHLEEKTTDTPTVKGETQATIETAGTATEEIVNVSVAVQTEENTTDALEIKDSTYTTDSSDSKDNSHLNDEIHDPLKLNPAPNKLRRDDFITDTEMFAAIDSFVEKVPSQRTEMISSLAFYLKSTCTNDLEIVRAIYKWIITNIRYDYEGFKTGNTLPCDPESVLQNRCAVCGGYARLFVALCRKLKIQAVILIGYAKGVRYKAENPMTYDDDPNHGWNAVFVCNEWRLIDCTWDADYIDDEGKLNHKKGQYFLTDPEIFLDEHLPYMEGNKEASTKWQLVHEPIDIVTFGERVVKKAMYYVAKVNLLSHQKPVILVKKETAIRIEAKFKDVLATLTGRDDKSNNKKFIFLYQTSTETYEIIIRPPAIATYTLTISGNIDGDTYENIVSYTLICQEVYEEIWPYPKHIGTWGPSPGYHDYGFDTGVADKVQFVAENGYVEIILPIATDVEKLPICGLFDADDIEIDRLYVFVEKQSNRFLLKIRLAKVGYYKLNVFAKSLVAGSSDCFDCIIRYLIWSQSAANCEIFPEIFSAACSFDVTILEPLNGRLKKDSKVTFRFHSAKLLEMMADNEMIDKMDTESDIWECTLNTPNEKREFIIYGKESEQSNRLSGLFRFFIV